MMNNSSRMKTTSAEISSRATKPQILGRMLLNLKRLYVRMFSFPQARDITEMLLAVDPSAVDELRDRVLGSVQSRVAVLAEKLARVEAELKQRDLAQVPTARLYALAGSLRRQIKQETDAIHFVAPVNAIPADEYVEQVQEWKP